MLTLDCKGWVGNEMEVGVKGIGNEKEMEMRMGNQMEGR